MARAIELREQGWSFKDIGALPEYDCSAAILSRRCREAGYVGRSGTSEARDWQNVILPRAAEIVDSYDTRVTLRQLHYRLVSQGIGGYLNNDDDYNILATRTAKLRREGRFPDLSDNTRSIHRYRSFESVEQALKVAANTYNRDGQETQDYRIYIAVEKRGIVAQLDSWFTEPYDIPIIPTGGYCSTPLFKQINDDALSDDRPSVLLYAGDLDPSGLDIFRHFVEQSLGWPYRGGFQPVDVDYRWHAVKHVALRIGQVEQFSLAVNEGKKADTRAKNFLSQYRQLFPNEADELGDFVDEHGDLFQVEVDALDPDDLRRLFEDALAEYHDEEKVEAVREREAEERGRLVSLSEGLT